MKEPVISHRKVPDKIQLEGKYNFSDNVTLGLTDSNDFYIELVFTNLHFEDFKILSLLSKLPRRLQISSDLIKKSNYNITHIVVTTFFANDMLEMTWVCLSDDPSMYSDINN